MSTQTHTIPSNEIQIRIKIIRLTIRIIYNNQNNNNNNNNDDVKLQSIARLGANLLVCSISVVTCVGLPNQGTIKTNSFKKESNQNPLVAESNILGQNHVKLIR